MYRLLLGALRKVAQESLMLGPNTRGAGTAYQGLWTAGTSSLSCRWSQAVRNHMASLLGRRGACVSAASSDNSALQQSQLRPRPRQSTTEQAPQHQHQQQQQLGPLQSEVPIDASYNQKLPKPRLLRLSKPAVPTSQLQTATIPVPTDRSTAAKLLEHNQTAVAAATVTPSESGNGAAPADGYSSATQQSAVVAAAVSGPNGANGSSQSAASSQHVQSSNAQSARPSVGPPKRPQPRRSSSVQSPSDEGSQDARGKKSAKSTAQATDGKQGGHAAMAQQPVQPSQPPPAAEAGRHPQQQQKQQQQQQQQPPLNMQLRNSVNIRKQPAVLVAPDSTKPLSQQAADWVNSLGIPPTALQSWGAGMAHVHHPDPAQGQVEVLALPYYRKGTLVDVRYLQLQDGQLMASWLARQAAAPFMDEQLVQDAKVVVFVTDELDVILLSALGVAAVALTKQRPVLNIQTITQSLFQRQQQQQEQEQCDQQEYQQPLQQQQQLDTGLWPLLQLSLERQLQHFRSSSQQSKEDPRLRLKGLEEEMQLLQRVHRVNTSSGSSTSSGVDGLQPSEGLRVGDVADRQVAGLNLMFPAATTAVIAMGSGPVGDAVADELARLLGEVLCNKVSWPAAHGPADAAAQIAADYATSNGPAAAAAQQYWSALESQLEYLGSTQWNFLLVHEIYQRYNQSGADAVRNCINNATIFPIAGLERFSDYAPQLVAYYETPDVGSLAVETGWPSLDECYRVAPGEVTIVTGVPNSGKSEWLDALAVNLARQHNWRFAVCSMEKRPRDHARQLVEKIVGKPMLRAAYAENVDRMSEQVLYDAYQWLADHFWVISSGESEMPKIQDILEKAKAAKIHHNINGLIVDPYNELDPSRSGPGIKEHEHVNELMACLRRFARDNKVHCWLVAHPRQFGGMWSGQAPGLQDISGGANFHNKADNGIVVHRDWSKMKEMQQRAAAEKGSSSGRRSSRRNSPEPGESSNSSSKNGTVGGADSDPAAPAHNIEYEVQIKVEKVRNKTSGTKGMAVLVYDRITGRYHEVGEQPNRGYLWEEAAQTLVRHESKGTTLEIVDAPDTEIDQVADVVGTSSSSSNGTLEEATNMEELAAQAAEW